MIVRNALRFAVFGALLGLTLGGCAPAQVASAVSTTCQDMAAMPPQAIASLNSLDPHSAIGVLWADAKSACANGAPVAGIDTSWGGMIWGELKVLIPQFLPQLVPLLVGLI